MDFKMFVQSLNTQEFEQLRSEVWRDGRDRMITHLNALGYQLTPGELAKAKENKIMAIKMVRDRLQLGLAESKTLVELRAGV